MERLTSRNEKGDLLLMDEQIYAGNFYEVVSALEEYEDAEEQGRLVMLPCKIGSTIYYLDEMKCPECPKRAEQSCDEKHYTKCNKMKIREGIFCFDDICEIGKTVFLTHKEAEATLKQM